MVSVSAVAVLGLGLAACAAPPQRSADSNTARVSIDDVALTLPVECTQLSWLWTIETSPQSPGFTAMLETGGTLRPRVMRIQGLAGFTGSAVEASDLTAVISGSTFALSGTAHGAFDARPTKPASVRYDVQARC